MGLIDKFLNRNYKTWRFSLISSLGDSLLEINPLGWDDVGLTLSKTEPYDSVFRTYSAELEYVKNGYDIIKELEETEGVLFDCDLKVEKRDHITLQDTEIFRAKIDPTDYKESTKNGKGISVPLVDDNFHEKLKSRENVDIPYDREIDIDGNTITAGTYETVSVKGREFGGSSVGAVYVDVEPGDTSNVYNLQQASTNDDTGILNVEFPNVELLPNYQNVVKEVNGDGFLLRGSEVCFYYTGNTTATISIEIKYTVATTGQQAFFNLYKILYNQDNTVNSWTVENKIEFYTDISGVINKQYNLPKYTGLHLYFGRPTLGSGVALLVKEPFEINVTDISSFEPTDCKVVLPHEAFSQCAYAITGELDSFRSNYFGRIDLGYSEDGEGAYLSTTKGLLLRGFPSGYVANVDEDTTLEERVAQLSYKFRELFDSYKKVKNLALRVVVEDGKYIIEVEKKEDLYSDEVSMTFERSDVDDGSLEIVRNIDMYNSGVDVGYVTQPDDLFGGLEEYSSREKYTSIISRNNDNVLDLVSKYNGSSVPIEKTRRKPYESTATEETTHDNTIFFIELIKEGGILIQREEQGFDEINGLANLETKINLGITPKQMMLAHGDSINVGLSKYPLSIVQYDSSDKTTDLSFKYTGSTTLITENGSEIAGSLLNPRFTGFKILFSSNLSLEQFIFLRNNTEKLVGVWSELTDSYIYGWIKELSTDVVDKETNIELIEANPPDLGLDRLLVTDEEKLIVTDEEKAIKV